MSNPLRVLLVEDNPGDADLVSELLADKDPAGFQIQHVLRMAEAVKTLKTDAPNLVLLDLSLPDSTGLETVRTMRAQCPDIPIVVMTGNNDEQTGLAAIKEGAQDYVVKGLASSALIDRVLRYAVERHQIVERLSAAEASRRESEQSLRSLLDAITESAFLMDPAGVLIAINDTACRRLGHTMPEMVGHSISEFVTPDLARSRRAEMDAVVRNKQARVFEDTYQGRWIQHSLYPILDGAGRVNRVAVFASDVTDIRQARQALQDANQLLDETQAMTHLGGWKYDVATRTFAWTKEVYRIYGVAATYDPSNLEQALGFFAGEDAAVIRRAFDRALEYGQPYDLKLQFARATGERIWVRTTGHPRIENDRVVAVVGNIMDITDQKRSEEQRLALERQVQQLQKTESLGRMAGSIAHLFNNHLMAVIGTLELSLLSLPADAELREPLQVAMGAARKAAETSRTMLTYLGHATGPQVPMELSGLCRRSRPLLQALQSPSASLEVELPDPGPVINSQADAVQHILFSLFTNASEALEGRPGVLRLSVSTAASPAAISARHRWPLDWQAQNKPYACLAVADTGCGIPAAEIDKLFDPFYSTKFIGRGLGLATVLGLVRTHQGCITVESTLGRGSTFKVYFPMAGEALVPPPPPTERVEAREGGAVMVVEDEDNVRQIAASMLKRLGFAVVEAADGAEAVALFHQHQAQIRCVICDLTMPVMDGWQTIAALRALRPGLPVVLASGYDKAQVMGGDHTELPQEFLGKPFQLTELKAAVHRALTSGTAGA